MPPDVLKNFLFFFFINNFRLWYIFRGASCLACAKCWHSAYWSQAVSGSETFLVGCLPVCRLFVACSLTLISLQSMNQWQENEVDFGYMLQAKLTVLYMQSLFRLSCSQNFFFRLTYVLYLHLCLLYFWKPREENLVMGWLPLCVEKTGKILDFVNWKLYKPCTSCTCCVSCPFFCCVFGLVFTSSVQLLWLCWPFLSLLLSVWCCEQHQKNKSPFSFVITVVSSQWKIIDGLLEAQSGR